MKKEIIKLLILFSFPLFVSAQIAPVGSFPDRIFTVDDLSDIIQFTDSYKEAYKVQNNLIVSTSEKWEPGTWGQGYFTDMSPADFLNKTVDGKYWGCHPLIRHTGLMVRGHIHARHLFPELNNLQAIKDGVDYLLAQQHSSGKFLFWKYRKDQNDTSYDSTVPTGADDGEEEFETSQALRALSEAYLYFNSIGAPYRNAELYTAITESADWLSSLHESWASWQLNSNLPALALWALSAAYKINNDCQYKLAVINICNKITSSARQVKSPAPNSTTGNVVGQIGDETGMWTWGSPESVTIGTVSYMIEHDSKIGYHGIILRGLVEALDVIPTTEINARTNLVQTIKLATNHIILHRLHTTPQQSFIENFTDSAHIIVPVSTNKGGESGFEPLALLAYMAQYHSEFSADERTYLKNLLNKVAPNLETTGTVLENIENLNAVAYYADYLNAINTGKRIFSGHWSNGSHDLTKLAQTTVSGDFDEDGKIDDILSFTSALAGNAIVWASDDHSLQYSGNVGWWNGTSYDATKIQGRVVSGDFDRDGHQDDVAAFYSYGPGNADQTVIHVWTSNGSSLHLDHSVNGWWRNPSYYASDLITGRLVSGDFDQDGFHDDLAAFYDYSDPDPNTGIYATRIHVWTSDGGAFTYKGNSGWWNSLSTGTNSYNPSKITGRIVCGDFDHDGYQDDIAAFYSYGPSVTKIHVWRSNGLSFDFNSTNGWWNSETSNSSYNADLVTNQVVSGDFDKDGYKDDIAAFYPYSAPTTTKIHVWRSNGNSFDFNSTDGWWASSSEYAADNITGRIVSGDFDEDTFNNDIAALYDYGSGSAIFHVWRSNPDIFEFQGVDGWWGEGCHPLSGTSSARVHSTGKITSFTSDADDENSQLSLYPNPTNGILNIELPKEDKSSIAVFNLLGKVIYSSDGSDTDKVSINLTNEPKGIYIIRIKSGTGSAIERFILQ
jgi:hypothetical protein